MKVAKLAVATLFRIAADSPLYGTSGTVEYELATWRVGHTDNAALVVLAPLRGAASDPRRYLYITPNDRSLRVSFHNAGTVFFVQ